MHTLPFKKYSPGCLLYAPLGLKLGPHAGREAAGMLPSAEEGQAKATEGSNGLTTKKLLPNPIKSTI